MKRFYLSVLMGVFLSGMVASSRRSTAQDSPQSVSFQNDVAPLLAKYCGDCHGGGASEGDLTLDHFASDAEAAAEPQLWWNVLKNIRAGVMPPADSPRIESDELELIAVWIKSQSFQIRADAIDPGALSVRRLNRSEYGNTVSDLMGIEFDATILFPPEDSGSGFDNMGDALTFSPMLMEKYLQASRMVVGEAVPTVTTVLPHQRLTGDDFVSSDGDVKASRMSGLRPGKVRAIATVDEPGKYTIDFRYKVDGNFEFDPSRYKVVYRIDGNERFSGEFGWNEDHLVSQVDELDWGGGEHSFELEIQPLPDMDVEGEATDNKSDSSGDEMRVHFDIQSVVVQGPVGTKNRVHPDRYERFFTRAEPPTDLAERRQYAREVLRSFCLRAFRGHANERTLDRLVTIAESTYEQSGTTFEQGIARAMVAVLASPRFIFRMENVIEPEDPTATFGKVDEFSLASRLSYLMWSTMPDDQLFQLAAAGELRKRLPEQIERMMSDDRAKQFVRNFVGQWLRTRDVTQTTIDPLVVLGHADEYNELREHFRSRRSRPNEEEMTDEEKSRFARYRELREIQDRFDSELRSAIRRETEMCFEYIASGDASLLDLLDSDYTFLNEKLAKHYDIPDVEGLEMRRVDLPEGSIRGGVLGHASMLVITSNPTRTSPVKRGLFILDNLLGTPAPPAPGVVPELEASASRFADREPTLRELLAVHRESALCASCHARMDPLGLALENFNALGIFRATENEQPIDPSGVLITGEPFSDVRELKQILRTQHAADFYRCVSQKMLTYAIGRGLDFKDEETVDLIVQRLQSSNGKFSELLAGVIASAPFQSIRINSAPDSELARSVKP